MRNLLPLLFLMAICLSACSQSASITTPGHEYIIDGYVIDLKDSKSFEEYLKYIEVNKPIDKITPVTVINWYGVHWVQGVVPFTGDTTMLTYRGRVIDGDLDKDNPLSKVTSRLYEWYDTTYIQPTHKDRKSTRLNSSHH